MTPAILRDTERVRDASDILKVIGDYIQLRKAGPARYVGLCPFHREKTPSFSVSVARQSFKCFGCGIGGDIFAFIQRRENVNFRRAKELLASRAGVVLEDRPLPEHERCEYARRRAAVEPEAERLASHVADWERGLELCYLHRQEIAASATEWLLSQDADPGELLADARRDLAILRNADADSLITVYRDLPEPLRRTFREAGRRDREHAAHITRAIVGMLAQVDQFQPEGVRA